MRSAAAGAIIYRVRVLRPVGVVVALMLCAWFVIGIRQANGVSTATDVVAAGRGAPAHQVASAAAALRSAEFLNPDQNVNILRGRLAIARGQLRQAQQILAQVTRREPLNLEAWIWFTGANLGNKSEARIGSARIAELDPLDARVGRR
jgi:predicted Zn-dependent protease